MYLARKICRLLGLVLLVSTGMGGPLSAGQTELLEQLSRVPVRKRLLKEPLFFSQAQLKYTLGPMQYHSCWTDRPLFLNPALVPSGYRYHYNRMTIPADLKKRCEILKGYDFDGFAFFYDNLPRESEKILRIISETDRKSMVIISPRSRRFAQAVENALASSGSLRIQGRPVFYVRMNHLSDLKKPEFAELRKKIFVISVATPQWPAWQHYYKGMLNEQDLEILRIKVRNVLDVADGFHWVEIGQKRDHGMIVAACDFYREVLMPVARQVLAEPAYQNKLFGADVSVGHENAYAYGYYLASRGTASLRSLMQTGLENHCDYFFQTEWDEENENTSLRPTVYNSRCYMRICRYYSAAARGKHPQPLPGDDLTIPNFALSMRKILTLGERLEIQLLNIPDGGKAEDYTVLLCLKNETGKVVWKGKPVRMKAEKMDARSIFLASEDFAGCRALLPVIDIDCKGQKFHFEKELHCVELRPQMNCDFKWVHQSFRDLMPGVKAEIRELPGREEGMKRFAVKVSSPQPFSQAELLEAHQPVAGAGEECAAARETDDHWAIRIMNFGVLQHQGVKGRMYLKNGVMSHRLDFPVWSRSLEEEITENSIPLDRFSRYPHLLTLILPKDKNADAVLCFDFPGLLQKEIPVQEIIRKKSLVINGEKGVSVGICRQLRQLFQPRWLNVKCCAFTVDTLPTVDPIMMHLRLIGMDGRLFYSPPVFAKEKLSGKKEQLRIYSESKGRFVTVDVPVEWVASVKYEVTEHLGALVPGSGCRRQWGVRGGFIEQATFHGGGDGSYGNLIAILSEDPLNLQKGVYAMKDFSPEISGDAWKFNGRGNHIQFTQNVIPRRADYRLSFECNPDHQQGCQVLFDATPHFYVPVTWRLLLDHGVLRMWVGDREYSAFFRLKPRQWNRVSIAHSRGRKLVFTVNGVSRAVPVQEGLQYDVAPLTLGGRPPMDWYQGRIRNLRVDYGKQ